LVVIVLLLVIIGLMLYFHHSKNASLRINNKKNWLDEVEKLYNLGQFRHAIKKLKVSEMHFPKNASVKWWYGRCFFALEKWDLAAEKFEECLRLDPFFRKHVNDYMSFIEINNLVPNVKGYLKNIDIS
jgi:tetratricopeptide (TPR) repeat protein